MFRLFARRNAKIPSFANMSSEKGSIPWKNQQNNQGLDKVLTRSWDPIQRRYQQVM